MYFCLIEFKLRLKPTITKVFANEYNLTRENVKNFFNSNFSYMKIYKNIKQNAIKYKQSLQCVKKSEKQNLYRDWC